MRPLASMLAVALLLGACEREQRHLNGPLAAAPGSDAASVTPAQERVAYDVTQGKRLYRWYNCSGCHGNGGGNMGPPLMDAKWRYGASSAEIVQSILQGRPNGMPGFAGRIPPDQALQLAAYIRSMSGQLRTDVAANRSDALSAGPPESRRDRLAPVREAPSSSPAGS
ncbi:c-type cytochrome [Ideonella sp. YS5]|uniref:c-type cytochrome n=1 Tax=Ideonella sp. YS5 TaxID=3453714 RepID=UPI003EEAEBDB